MTRSQFFRYAGWSAYVNAAATILGFVTIIAFFIAGPPFGIINDASSVVIALSTLPVLFTLYQLHRPAAPTASLAAFVVGAIAMLVATVLQTLLIVKVIAYAQTAATVPAMFGFFGASLLVYGCLTRAESLQPAGLAYLSIIAGAGYLMVMAGILLNGQENPLAAIGGLMAVICYPIWAIWFGRLLLSGRLAL